MFTIQKDRVYQHLRDTNRFLRICEVYTNRWDILFAPKKYLTIKNKLKWLIPGYVIIVRELRYLNNGESYMISVKDPFTMSDIKDMWFILWEESEICKDVYEDFHRCGQDYDRTVIVRKKIPREI